MVKARTKKLAAAAVSILLVLALLAGCAKKSAGGSASSQNKATNTGSSGNKPITLTMFIDWPWYPIKQWKGAIADEITKQTGVKLNISVAADTKQLPTMIASGNLPDLIFAGGQDANRLSNSKLSYAWNKLISKDAPGFKIDPLRKLVNTMPDGNFYTVKNAFVTPQEEKAHPFAVGNDGNMGVAFREDIFKKLGDPPIKTLNDFVNVLEQVKKKYPKMIPLVMDINWEETYFKAQFGIDAGSSELYVGNDGKVHFYITHPNMLNYYKFFNMLYRKGLILGENFAFSNDQIDDNYANSGKAFAHMHTVSVADTDNAVAKKNGTPYKWKMLPEALTPQAVVVSDGTGFSGTFITKNNKHPKASIKFLQYLAQPKTQKLIMWGIQGKQWHMSQKGYPVFSYDPNNSDYIQAHGLKWYYFYSDGVYEDIRGYVPGSQNTKALLEVKKIKKYKPVLGMIQPPSDSEYATIKTKLDNMIKTQRTKIILAKTQQEAVQAYHQMVKIAKQEGMAKYEKWATDQYKKKQALYKTMK